MSTPIDRQIADAFEAYASKYVTYNTSAYRSRLVMVIGEKVLAEYPKGLPPAIQDALGPFVQGFEQLLSGGQRRVATGTDATEQKGEVVSAPRIEDHREILSATVGLMTFHRGGDKFDFSRTVYSNEVVMQVAYLDAFVKDTIAEICRIRPGVRVGDKRLRFFGERVNWFKEVVQLDLKVAETQIGWLEEAENVRHIIVHNDGRVDSQFLDRTGRKDLSIGMPFPLIPHYLLRVYRGGTGFVSTLFAEVAVKVFHCYSIADASLESRRAVIYALSERNILREIAEWFSKHGGGKSAKLNKSNKDDAQS